MGKHYQKRPHKKKKEKMIPVTLFPFEGHLIGEIGDDLLYLDGRIIPKKRGD